MSAHPDPRQLLPVEAYTTADWFERERAELFGRVWAFAAMTEDLAEPGDFVSLQAGRYPLVVLCDGKGVLRAFHNVCRHRGSRLLEGAGNVGRGIRCFYHNWAYDLAGRLRSVPQEATQFPGLDKSCYGLHAAGVATLRNMVFVHPDPGAAPFEDWLDGFPETLGPHPVESLIEVSRYRYRVRANWKIVIENFIDGYHFFYLHPVSLGDGDFSRQDWTPSGRHWSFYRPLKPGVAHNREMLPVVEGVDPTYGAGAYVLFPNLALYATATYWSTFLVEPVAPDHSIVDIRVRAMPEALDRIPAETDDGRDLPDCLISATGPLGGRRMMATSAGVHPLGSDDVMLEDIYACEAVQKGMASPMFEVGPMSKFESSVTFHQQQVLDFMPLQSAAARP